MQTILIKGGRIIDPASNLDKVSDIFISDGKIAKVSTITQSAQVVIDAKNLIVTPGLIDIHTHLREPGREDKETIETASQAAVAGGFTSIACMANCEIAIDNEAAVGFIISRARECAKCNIFPIGAVTKGLKGEQIAELYLMSQAGAVGFSDDGSPIMNSHIMRRALEYSKILGKPIISHCEDTNLSQDGIINEGTLSLMTGLKGQPDISEEIMVARDITLAKFTRGRLHIAHVSAKNSCRLIKIARQEGVNITAEVTPHHLVLTDECLMEYDSRYKINPPLRTKEDVEALVQAINDGTIDAIASDHAPHTVDEKQEEIYQSPFGVVGLETTVGALFTYLVGKKSISLQRAIALLSYNPARILGLEKGTLTEGKDADITIIDPDLEWEVDSREFKSKGKSTPFDGCKLKGRAVYTIVGGKIVHDLNRRL